ncbi:MAG: hypothetical protein AAGB04_25410 [Pseudomonadota bacterium]
MTGTSSTFVNQLIGAQVLRQRLLTRKSPEEAANALSISLDLLNEFETGQCRIPSGTLLEMTKLYNCEISDFLPTDTEGAGKKVDANRQLELTNLKLACIEAVARSDEIAKLRQVLMLLS